MAAGGICEEENFEALCAPSVPPTAQPSPSPSTAAPSPPSQVTDVDGSEAEASGGGDGGGSSDSGGTVIAALIVAVLLLAVVSVLVIRARTQAKRTRGSMTSAPPVTGNPIHALSPSLVARQHPRFSDAPGTVDDALDFLGGLEDTTDEIGMATPGKKTIAWGDGELGMQPSELGSASRYVTPERVRVLSTPANNNHESAV